jgi:hypothetical protein
MVEFAAFLFICWMLIKFLSHPFVQGCLGLIAIVTVGCLVIATLVILYLEGYGYGFWLNPRTPTPGRPGPRLPPGQP